MSAEPGPPAPPIVPETGEPLVLPLPDPEHRRGGWREVLRIPRYRLLLATQLFAGTGYAVYSVSVLFLAYGLTGNLLIAGAVLFVEYGVYAGSFLIAPVVDRVRDKRRILLACFPVQAVAAGTLAYELHAGTLTIPVLLGIVFVLAVLWDFDWVVFNIAPRIVLPPRLLFIGDGITSAIAVGTQIGGYAGGGALVYLVGPFGGASAYAILLLGATAVCLPLSLAVEESPRTRFWETFRRGWEAFRGTAGRTLRQLAALDIVAGFFASIPTLLIPAIAYQRFSDPAAVYGPLVTAYAVGGSVAGIVIGHLNPRARVGRILILTLLSAGAFVLLLAPSWASLAGLALLLAGVGAALTIRYTSKYTWLQGSYAPEFLGRLSANLYLFTGISSTVAVLLFGYLSLRLPLGTLTVLDGVGLIASGVFALTLVSVRRMAF